MAAPGAKAEQDRRDLQVVQQHGIQDSPRQDRGLAAGQESLGDSKGGMDERHRHGRLGLADRSGDQESGRGRHAASGQPPLELLASPGQAAADRHGRRPQLVRRRVVGQPLQVAEHHGGAEPLGQVGDLLMEDLPVGIVDSRDVALGGPLRAEPVDRPPPRGPALAADRHAVRDAEQPTRDRPAIADRTGPVRQDQEDGLEGVLGVVRVVEDAPADPQDHRPVPAHQLLESRLARLAAIRDEPVQQLAVRRRPDRPEVPQPAQLVRRPARHFRRSPWFPVSSV